MFFGYILKSRKSGQYYVGHSEDLEQRLREHNTGLSRYTRSHRPWTLVFRREFETRSEAAQWELAVKKRKSKKFIEKLVGGQR
jgi:predicted GIY-YIG superfamily endonuclease